MHFLCLYLHILVIHIYLASFTLHWQRYEKKGKYRKKTQVMSCFFVFFTYDMRPYEGDILDISPVFL